MNAHTYGQSSLATELDEAPPRRLFVVASLLAAVALLLTVVGPGLSHHYGELSPYHSHLFLSGETEHVHDSFAGGHTHSDAEDVLSVTSDSGSGASGLHIAPVSSGEALAVNMERSVLLAYGFSLVIAIPDPPDRPPISS